MLCYIGVGSNLGDRLKNIKTALACLKKVKGLTIKRVSSLYETEPQGGPAGQEDYFNLVCEADSLLGPRDLLLCLKEIEKKMGRRPSSARWSAREIDLDILICDDFVVKEEDLTLPHPLMHERSFVLKPLTDLAPHLRHPLLGAEVSALLASLKENGRCKKITTDLTL